MDNVSHMGIRKRIGNFQFNLRKDPHIVSSKSIELYRMHLSFQVQKFSKLEKNQLCQCLLYTFTEHCQYSILTEYYKNKSKFIHLQGWKKISIRHLSGTETFT